MLDIGWPEMLLVLVLALMVIGPADLPKAMHGLGKAMRKMRMMSRAFQDSLDELVREAEIEEIQKEAKAAQQKLIEEIDVEDDMRDLMSAGHIDFDDGTTPDVVDTERDAPEVAPEVEKPKKKAPAKKKTPAKKSSAKKKPMKKAPPKKGGAK